jgi:hypothetical protein
MKNIIQTQLTPADREKIDDLINQLEQSLYGKLTALTEEERSRYGAINEQNKLLVNKVRDYRQTNAVMSSPDVNWDDFENDYQARVFLETRSSRLASLVYQMQSTKILHDNDNYQDALNDYAYSQYKRGANEPGFSEKVAEIKQFFPKSSKNKPPAEGDSG